MDKKKCIVRYVIKISLLKILFNFIKRYLKNKLVMIKFYIYK
jgi:hypothetical protein